MPLLLPILTALTLGLCSPTSHAAPTLTGRPKIIYQIFARSFQSSTGDGVGDLNGVTERLDYLAWLGVDALWITPIFDSPSYHGYDAKSYDRLRPEYGDDAAFDRLIEGAHARGIRIILDMAVNHSSNQHPWFQSSASSPHSPDRDLYLWSPKPLHWSHAPINPGASPESLWHALNGAYYFATFSSAMPDLNWRNPRILRLITDSFAAWTAKGVDGFRLDAAKFLVKGPDGEQNTPETHGIWRSITGAVHALNPDAFFIGEIWDSEATLASYEGQGDELSAAFDFPVTAALRQSLTSSDGSVFARALQDRLQFERSADFGSPFLGNHDMERFADAVGQDPHLLRLGAAAVLTLPGTPVVYYGDELGLPGGQSGSDLDYRTPMPWDASADRGFGALKAAPWNNFSTGDASLNVEAQRQDPRSLLNFTRALIVLRKTHHSLFEAPLSDVEQPAPALVSYRRVDAARGELALVFLNFGGAGTDDLRVTLPPGTARCSSVGPQEIAFTPGQGTLTIKGLAARQSAILICARR